MGKHANGRVLGMLEPFLLGYSAVVALLALEETPGQNLIAIIVIVQLMREFAGFSQTLQGANYRCHWNYPLGSEPVLSPLDTRGGCRILAMSVAVRMGIESSIILYS